MEEKNKPLRTLSSGRQAPGKAILVIFPDETQFEFWTLNQIFSVQIKYDFRKNFFTV